MKILKYLDFFGIHFHFYVGNKRKLYTSYGGIISLICVFCCVCIFLILCFKELLHKNPISNMSSVFQASYHKVKFGKEKLWIPWRIIDVNKNFMNFKNLLYPKISIIKGEKNKIENRFSFRSNIINYKLCNETDFAQRGENYFLDIPLNELYCMEMQNIELGGGWNADFLNYLQIVIFICKDGIEYDENNKNCTKYQNLKNNNSKNSPWGFEYFYPVVEFQPTNYKDPVFVTYKNRFYNFSNILNKEERMYFQEYVLDDDKGLIFNEELNSSFWGYISSDFDILYSNREVINENSSKLYSLSIFLDSGKILYTRRYNKIYAIIANVFPIFNVVFFIFNCLTYMVKTIMTEKYLSELFFKRENEQDKINVDTDKRKSAGFFYHKYKINLSLSKRESRKNVNNYSIHDILKNADNNNRNQENNKINNESNSSSESKGNYNEENNKYNFSNNSGEDNNKYNFLNNSEINKNNFSCKIRENNIKDMNISKKSSKDTNTQKNNIDKFNSKLKKVISNANAQSFNNSSFLNITSPKINNFVKLNKNPNEEKKKPIKAKKRSNRKSLLMPKNLTNIELNNKNITKTGCEDKQNEVNNFSHYNFRKNKGLNNSAIITRFRLKGSLFSMKDYIYSFFVKAIRKEYKYLSKEFTAIFNFLSEIYDISSYLQLYKQFHILSGFLLDNVADIDINHKININNKDLFEQVALKNKNVFYFALKEQIRSPNK